jgi:DNA-directed RNA polymerase subunit M/transcription elongation factor TFIIS
MSASPEPTDSSGDAGSKKMTFRFCSEWYDSPLPFFYHFTYRVDIDLCNSSNLLYPKEDKENSKLLLACRTCSYSMEAPTSCVARHEVTSFVGDTAGITQDVGSDPTVGAPSDSIICFGDVCAMCGDLLVKPHIDDLFMDDCMEGTSDYDMDLDDDQYEILFPDTITKTQNTETKESYSKGHAIFTARVIDDNYDDDNDNDNDAIDHKSGVMST